MRYRRRQDREIKQRMRMSRPYESRKSMRERQNISTAIDRFSKNLSGYGSAEAMAYVPKFTSVAKTKAELLDKYYIPYHRPPLDILTENFGDQQKKASAIPLGIMLLLILLLLKS